MDPAANAAIKERKKKGIGAGKRFLSDGILPGDPDGVTKSGECRGRHDGHHDDRLAGGNLFIGRVAGQSADVYPDHYRVRPGVGSVGADRTVLGKGGQGRHRRVIGIALRFSLLVSALFTVAAVGFPKFVLRIFTPDEAVIAEGVRYLRIVGISYLFAGFSILYLNVIRSVEKVAVSLVIYSISFVLNIFLNWMLVFGNLGAPRMGIAGAATATLTVKVLEAVLTLLYAVFVNKAVRLKFSYLFARAGVLMRDFRRYAAPVLLNELFWGVGVSMQSVILGHMGSEAVAASPIAKVAQQLATVVMFGIANSTAVIVGKAIGAGNQDYAKRAAKSLMRLGTIAGVAAMGIILLCRPLIASMYDLSDTAMSYTMAMMLILAFYTPLQSFNTTAIIGVMRGGGDSKFGMYLDGISLWCVALVLGSLGAFFFHLSVPVVYLLLICDELVKVFFGVRRVHSGKWLTNVTREHAALE